MPILGVVCWIGNQDTIKTLTYNVDAWGTGADWRGVSHLFHINIDVSFFICIWLHMVSFYLTTNSNVTASKNTGCLKNIVTNFWECLNRHQHTHPYIYVLWVVIVFNCLHETQYLSWTFPFWFVHKLTNIIAV